VDEDGSALRCRGCDAVFPVEDGMPRMLDDRLPGIAAKRREIEGWVAMAKAHGWYEPDDDVDAHLPYLNRDLGWDDKNWRATEHSFSLLVERHVRPGLRVLEVGAAKAWASQHLVPLGCEYVATDILDDPSIGLGRGAFYEARVGPFARVQADGEHLPFASGSFDLTFCVAALHHALDLRAMVRELSRVTRRGGWVCALNEGTRAVRAPADVPDQAEEKGHGINEHVHTLYAYLWAFARSGLIVWKVEQAEGYEELRGRRIAGRLLRLPLVGRSAATFFSQSCHGYSGVSLYARRPGT
jgi:SAM-dependent methyltransferase